MAILTVFLDRCENLADKDLIGKVRTRKSTSDGSNRMGDSIHARVPQCSHAYLVFLSSQSDPYVKFELEQDNFLLDKDFGERKSSVKKGKSVEVVGGIKSCVFLTTLARCSDSLSPVYGETFTFTLPDDIGLKNIVLKIKIMDDDPLHDDKLGSARVKLEGLGLGATPKPVEAVVDKNFFAKDGKIFLKLSYKK
jgi:C2 domain